MKWAFLGAITLACGGIVWSILTSNYEPSVRMIFVGFALMPYLILISLIDLIASNKDI